MIFKEIKIECEHCGKEISVDVDEYFDDDDFLENLEDWQLKRECVDRKIIKKISLKTYIEDDDDGKLKILKDISSKEKRELIAQILGDYWWNKEDIIKKIEELDKTL